MPRAMKPVFRFRSLLDLYSVTETAIHNLICKYGEDKVNQDSPVSVVVDDKVRVEFLRSGFCEYEYTASYNSEDREFGTNVCCELSHTFETY
ncbi:unnamed protein product [Hymenolepis diminuta]|uniref:Uncharacterized protein n=1 Tax=Hymenolepis diminuta TaxID=6216 RepID=A0A564YDR4_HYMDI|nr:unnamed protein product [Hymenolepis diminuta]